MNELNIQNIFQDYNEVVDIKALQTMLNISRSFAYDLIKKEKIKCIKCGHKILIPKKCVIDFLNGDDNNDR